MRHARRAAFAALLLLGTGCVEHFNAVQLGLPVTMASPAAEPAQGEPFRVNQSSIHAFWGLLALSRADLEAALGNQLLGGRGVADVKITIRSKWTDVLFSVVTLGVIIPRTVTFEGVITGAPATPPPAPPPPD